MLPCCSPVVNGRKEGNKKDGKRVKLAIIFTNQVNILNGLNVLLTVHHVGFTVLIY
jgi:hypothetical protein